MFHENDVGKSQSLIPVKVQESLYHISRNLIVALCCCFMYKIEDVAPSVMSSLQLCV